MKLRYFLLNKPYGYLSQFTDNTKAKNKTLGELYDFPRDVYSVGRLDKDSEGLLIITNDKGLNHRLLNPRFQHEREYYALVQGAINEDHLKRLEEGVVISLGAGQMYKCRPAKARKLENEPNIGERAKPISSRGDHPLEWLSLTLHEGKNRQVRKMTAAVGLPTLRLFRARIEGLNSSGLKIGETIEMEQEELMNKLFKKA